MRLIRKSAKKLAELYDMGTQEEFYEYIFHSYIVGQKSQCISLFNKMNNSSQEEFLKSFVEEMIDCYKGSSIVEDYSKMKKLLIREIIYR